VDLLSQSTISRRYDAAITWFSTAPRLAYLNIIEKVNCAYCSYGNGVISICAGNSRENRAALVPDQTCAGSWHHEHYNDFLAFGDASAYRAELKRCAQNWLSCRALEPEDRGTAQDPFSSPFAEAQHAYE